MPRCNSCNEEKLEMDMNSKDICKDCWYRKEDIKYSEAVIEGWKTRRKNKSYVNGYFSEDYTLINYLEREKKKII